MKKAYTLAIAAALSLAANAQQSGMITSQPEGKLYKNMYSYSTGFVSMSGLIMEAFSDGSTKDMVIADDGTFYLKNPVSQMPTPGWIRGHRTQGDTVVFTTPQQIYVLDNGDGNKVNYSVYRMKYEEVDGNNQYVVDNSNRDLRFVWRNDSLIKLDDDVLIGMGNENGVWNGLGDLTMSATPCPFTAAVPPADATQQKYVVTYNVSTNSTQRRIMTVAMNADSTQVWVKGVDSSIPNAWVTAPFKNNQAQFELQFLGLDTVRSGYKFLVPAVEKWNDQEYYSYLSPLQYMTLTYTPKNGTWKSSDGYYTNYGYRKAQSYYQIYGKPSFAVWNYKPAAPRKPSIMQFEPASTNSGYVIFSINNNNQRNSFMDPDSTFYNVYFDEELVTFYPDQYTNFSTEVTDIPLNYQDASTYNIETYGNQHRLVIYDSGFTNIGIRAFTVSNGERLYSETAWYPKDPTAVSLPTVDSPVTSVTYHDLTGRRISKPTSGLYIKTTVRADGTTQSEKVVATQR